MPNPWMSFWLSAANSWAGAARGFWTAEMHRQQRAMANEMVRWRRSPATSRSAAADRYAPISISLPRPSARAS
jgi:hypothetical protein